LGQKQNRPKPVFYALLPLTPNAAKVCFPPLLPRGSDAASAKIMSALGWQQPFEPVAANGSDEPSLPDAVRTANER
jgi:hypothetical protein